MSRNASKRVEIHATIGCDTYAYLHEMETMYQMPFSHTIDHVVKNYKKLLRESAEVNK